MMQSTLRPMTDAERQNAQATLGRLRKPHSWRSAVGTWFAFTCLMTGLGFILGGIVAELLKVLGVSSEIRLIVLFAGLGLGFLLGSTLGEDTVRSDRRRTEAQRLLLEQHLTNGQVEVMSVTASDCVRVRGYENPEDEEDEEDDWEEPAFFFDIGGGQLLFLIGDYLRDSMDFMDNEEVFPCQRFDLIRYPGEAQVQEVVCHGPQITPVRVITWDELNSGYLPSDSEVLKDVRLESLLEDLKRLGNEPG